MARRDPPWLKQPPTTRPTVATPKRVRLRYDVLRWLAQERGWRRGAELGLQDGRTAAHLLRSLPSLTLIGVDLWAPQPDHAGPENWVGWDHGQHEREARLALAPFADRVVIYKCHTVAAADHVAAEALDFVFIDADHSEHGVRADIMAWRPKIRPGGAIVLHDINWPGVKAAADALLPGYEVGPDNTAWREI